MHKGIELRIELDGKLIVAGDSALLNNLVQFAAERSGDFVNLLDGVNRDSFKGIRVLVRAVNLLDDAELDQLENDDEDQDEDEAPHRPTVHWWDRAEFSNWKLIDGGPAAAGVTLMHLPCGQRSFHMSSLTFVAQRAAEHKCPLDRPASAAPIVREWVPVVTEDVADDVADLPTELHPYDVMILWANRETSQHTLADYQAMREYLSDLDFKDWRRMIHLAVWPNRG